MDFKAFDPVELFSPILLALLVLELLISYFTDKKVYNIKDFLASLSMGIGAYLIHSLLKVGSAAYLLTSAFQLTNTQGPEGYQNFLGHPSFGWSWGTFLICAILVDFSHYWVHRLNHTVRIMWAAHVVHHSSEHYNFGTGVRISWIALLYKPLFYLWLPALGFRPEMILICIGIESVWQYLLHTEYCPNLGFLEWILITPRQHMVHHGRNPEYIDKNHGAILNLFDRIFGTWRNFDKNIEIDYGVTHPPKSFNPAIIIFHEYRDILRDVKTSRNLREAFRYVFGPPGWKPESKPHSAILISRERPGRAPKHFQQTLKPLKDGISNF